MCNDYKYASAKLLEVIEDERERLTGQVMDEQDKAVLNAYVCGLEHARALMDGILLHGLDV